MILAIVGIVLGGSLYFSIRCPDNKPALTTCAIQVAARFFVLAALITLHLWGTLGVTILAIIGWAILLIQQLRKNES